MKAQTVKNAVIVPVGAKGGFVMKRPPDPTDRDAWLAEGIACYRTLICGLLDLTDNRVGGGIEPPTRVVRRDGDDPYLVVAADKGTATFSDIANGIAADYGFWLGDAFASGGSRGYDHKVMGITAKGAWEGREAALPRNGPRHPEGGLHRRRRRRHVGRRVRQRHAAVAAHPAAGGLRSPPHLHRPRSRRGDQLRRAPAAVRAAALVVGELRGRAAVGRAVASSTAAPSSWCCTPEIRDRFGIDAERMTPNELMQTLLQAEVDLLWFGGIGTYVKATEEIARRGRRPGQRRGARRRPPAALQGGGRRRQPGRHPARPDRVRARRRAHQHRLHRQLGRRRLLRPRGQHQDPARRHRRRRRHDDQAAQPRFSSR